MSWSWGILFLKFLDGMPTSYSPTLIRSVLATGLGWVGLFLREREKARAIKLRYLPVPVRLGCRLYCRLYLTSRFCL